MKARCGLELQLVYAELDVNGALLKDYIDEKIASNVNIKIFEGLLASVEEKMLVYYFSDDRKMEEAIQHKHYLEDELKKMGFPFEILIKKRDQHETVVVKKLKSNRNQLKQSMMIKG